MLVFIFHIKLKINNFELTEKMLMKFEKILDEILAKGKKTSSNVNVMKTAFKIVN
jgi:hypothetical protein